MDILLKLNPDNRDNRKYYIFPGYILVNPHNSRSIQGTVKATLNRLRIQNTI